MFASEVFARLIPRLSAGERVSELPAFGRNLATVILHRLQAGVKLGGSSWVWPRNRGKRPRCPYLAFGRHMRVARASRP